MTREELNLLLRGLNNDIRTYCSFEDAESNNEAEKGWFNEDDIRSYGISIDEA